MISKALNGVANRLERTPLHILIWVVYNITHIVFALGHYGAVLLHDCDAQLLTESYGVFLIDVGRMYDWMTGCFP
jgi:hypothetical protein